MPSLKILFRMSCLKKAPRRLSRFITKPRPPVILSGATRPFLAHLFCAPGRVAKNLSSLRSAFRKPSVAFALLLAVSSIIPARVSSQTSEAQIEQSFRAGQQALKQGDFTHAAEDFKKVLALDPSLVEAEVNLGLAYQSLFEYDLAVRHLAKALRKRPNLLGPTVIVGMDYLKLGSPERAIPFLQHALKLDSSNELAWIALANLQLTKGQATAVLESLSKAWEISPEFLNGQRSFPSTDLPPESAKASVSRLQNEPDGAPKHFLLAALYAAANENALSDSEWKSFEAGFSAWQQAQNAPPHSNATSSGDACRTHHYSRCIDLLQARKPLTDSERLLLGKTHFALQQYELAADALGQVQGVTSENAEASYWLARTYQALGAAAYAQLEQSFPNSWRAHQLHAEGLALRQDPDGAIKEYQTALELRPGEAELHEALGQLYLDNHSDGDAQSELERALALDPSRTHALYLLGRLYVQNRDNERAVPYLQRALLLQPDLAEASELLGTAYVRLGQFANAVPRLEKAAPRDHYGNVHYQLYLAYHKLGRNELAKKALSRSQELRRSSLERDQALILGSPQPQPDPQ